ncbi:hypothetical protein V5N11_003542 [Cardamine amara subsp. amara]|uniref:Zinc knuckle CX2CX4HX4C domain-containing protein n=1 Tax=Cardamine amara subsp. amara TaxID=228776 RepID=A0ABD1C216_CARAN
MRIWDLPLSCWDEEAFKGIGDSLGQVETVDVTEARVLVSVDVTKPLRFKKKVITDKGDMVQVALFYEKLHRYCDTCFMISHEEKDCALLTDHQVQAKPRLRYEDRGDTRRNHVPGEEQRGSRREFLRRINRDQSRSQRPAVKDRIEKARGQNKASKVVDVRDQRDSGSRRDSSSSRRHVRRNLYQSDEYENGETRNSVWQQLGTERATHNPRTREQSIQASSNPQGSRDDGSKGKGSEAYPAINRRDLRTQRNGSRRVEEPFRIREPGEEEPNLKQWRNSR